jgi:hypothetical protein
MFTVMACGRRTWELLSCPCPGVWCGRCRARPCAPARAPPRAAPHPSPRASPRACERWRWMSGPAMWCPWVQVVGVGVVVGLLLGVCPAVEGPTERPLAPGFPSSWMLWRCGV